jgi:hypothetical protein
MKQTRSKLLFDQAKGTWRQWQVAAQMDISEQTLIRWLRFDLSSEQESKVMRAIDELNAGLDRERVVQ